MSRKPFTVSALHDKRMTDLRELAKALQACRSYPNSLTAHVQTSVESLSSQNNRICESAA